MKFESDLQVLRHSDEAVKVKELKKMAWWIGGSIYEEYALAFTVLGSNLVAKGLYFVPISELLWPRFFIQWLNMEFFYYP